MGCHRTEALTDMVVDIFTFGLKDQGYGNDDAEEGAEEGTQDQEKDLVVILGGRKSKQDGMQEEEQEG